MSNRISQKDVKQAAHHLENALRHNNLINTDERIILSIGSKTYGNAYRVNLGKTKEDGSMDYAHYSFPIGGDFLGMTAAEAYEAITARTRTINDVFYVLARNGAVQS